MILGTAIGGFCLYQGNIFTGSFLLRLSEQVGLSNFAHHPDIAAVVLDFLESVPVASNLVTRRVCLASCPFIFVRS